MPDPIRAHLVCGGRWHDMDFARLELLKLLAADPEIRVRVTEDFRDTEAIAEADFLLTYTCDLRLEDGEQRALADFVGRGKRWFTRQLLLVRARSAGFGRDTSNCKILQSPIFRIIAAQRS